MTTPTFYRAVGEIARANAAPTIGDHETKPMLHDQADLFGSVNGRLYTD
jgi:hypothetical protein